MGSDNNNNNSNNDNSNNNGNNITRTSRTPLTTETQQQQQQQQQPTQAHEETIDAIAAATPVDDEDGLALANYFRELQLDLTRQMHERESRLPKCYEEGTFWITPPNAFFTLWNKTKKSNNSNNNTTASTTNTTTTTTSNPTSPTAATSTIPNDSNTPTTTTTDNKSNNNSNNHPYSELICMKRPRIFVWLVHLLVDILHCPSETCHLKKLQSHGWATAPCARRILDLHSDFYLMSYRYKCTHCKRTFFGHDQAIRDSLPTALAEEFPAVLSHRSGISRSTLELMQSCSTSAIGPFTRILKEHHALRSARLKLQFLAAKKEAETTTPSSSLSNSHHSKKRRMNHTISSSSSSSSSPISSSTPLSSSASITASPSSSSFVAIAPQPISNLNQQRSSVPPPIAPRPPQATPVFLPQPIFAMHPHLVALQHKQQQQLQHPQQQQGQQSSSPSSQQRTNRRKSTPIVPKTTIPLQPLYYTLQRSERSIPSPSQPIQVPKKPRKPRTILKKPN